MNDDRITRLELMLERLLDRYERDRMNAQVDSLIDEQFQGSSSAQVRPEMLHVKEKELRLREERLEMREREMEQREREQLARLQMREETMALREREMELIIRERTLALAVAAHGPSAKSLPPMTADDHRHVMSISAITEG